MGKPQGHRGCMIGNNSASVLVDAYLKGVKVDDVKTLYEWAYSRNRECTSGGFLLPDVSVMILTINWVYVPYEVKINEMQPAH